MNLYLIFLSFESKGGFCITAISSHGIRGYKDRDCADLRQKGEKKDSKTADRTGFDGDQASLYCHPDFKNLSTSTRNQLRRRSATMDRNAAEGRSALRETNVPDGEIPFRVQRTNSVEDEGKMERK